MAGKYSHTFIFAFQLSFELIIAISSILFISGCGTLQTQPCITEKQKGLIIKWGDYDNGKREFNGHLMKTNAGIFSVKGAGLMGKYDEETLVAVASENYCSILNDIRQEFLSTQTLNAPGEISRIIEFNNPATNVVLRAVWNPKFQTFGSKGFREIYDQLQDLLKNDK